MLWYKSDILGAEDSSRKDELVLGWQKEYRKYLSKNLPEINEQIDKMS